MFPLTLGLGLWLSVVVAYAARLSLPHSMESLGIEKRGNTKYVFMHHTRLFRSFPATITRLIFRRDHSYLYTQDDWVADIKAIQLMGVYVTQLTTLLSSAHATSATPSPSTTARPPGNSIKSPQPILPQSPSLPR
ncbi:hypothetical protein C0992_003276 [Termitomyces sp. T32_za158]|nr:hypothetical protein C0992_003276 [Termitomyces sp. T32_za158]